MRGEVCGDTFVTLVIVIQYLGEKLGLFNFVMFLSILINYI